MITPHDRPIEEESSLESSESEETEPRPLEELKSILKSDRCDLMNNLEIIELILEINLRSNCFFFLAIHQSRKKIGHYGKYSDPRNDSI